MRAARLALPALLVVAAVAWQAPGSPPPGIQWGPAPPFFPAGARFAVLQGDPGKTGLYTVRLSMPSGYTIKPHFHPTDEHITVLSGTFAVGMSDSVDMAHVHRFAAGDFGTAGAQVHHFGVAEGRTVVQVHGMGPFAITYVKASDDPRRTMGTH
jgi:quercetin dioxygenase-like cupin family protein